MAEAKLNKEYAFRISGVGALMLAICAWSIYDGHVAWPRDNARMEKARPFLLATNLTAEAWLDVSGNGVSPLQAVFGKQGEPVPGKLIRKIGELRLPDRVTDNREEQRALLEKQVAETFKKPVYSSHDLGTQTVQAIATGLLGLLVFFSLALKAPKRFYADETGLHGNGFGRAIPYGDLVSIDWRQWRKKGIAVLQTKEGKVTLDAWHFAGIKGIMDEIVNVRQDLKDVEGS